MFGFWSDFVQILSVDFAKPRRKCIVYCVLYIQYVYIHYVVVVIFFRLPRPYIVVRDSGFASFGLFDDFVILSGFLF